VWPLAVRERWPGRMRPLATRRLLPAAIVGLHGRSFDLWLAERSARVRADARRRRRLFEQAGGTYRLAKRASIAADLRTFAELHARRWEGRGKSRLVALGEQLTVVLGDIANHLLDEERFRLLLLEIDGEPICGDVGLAAGGEVIGFNFGWDERHRRLSPPLLSLLHTIEDSCRRREQRIWLGWGAPAYKARFANGSDAVTWDTLLPPGRQLTRALPRALPDIASRRARQTTKRLLGDERVPRLKDLLAATKPRPG
jgi:CelD/BcsL family acetyltransferase involved in cellulose biosynthesis